MFTKIDHGALTVRVARRGADQGDYRVLLGDQRRWIEEELGFSIDRLQPHAVAEYADPFAAYRRSATIPLLARVGGEPVGICALSPVPGQLATLELKRMFVHGRARGAGVGGALLDTAVTVARHVGAERVVLETHEEHMPAAAALYRRVGFVDTAPLGVTRCAGVLTMELLLQPRRKARSLLQDAR